VELVKESRRLSAREGGLPEGTAPEGTRGRILEAALVLFAERGFWGASIRDIAEATGLRSATLYAHYASKEQILADLVLIGHEEHHGALQAASDPADTFPNQLANLVRAHVRFHAEHPRLALVANAELHALSADLVGPALTLRDGSTQMLLDVAQRGVEAGVFAPVDVWLAVAAIGGMGIRVANWYPHQNETIDEVADAYAQFALAIMQGATS
jgi:AcrR family transcriptional regulator